TAPRGPLGTLERPGEDAEREKESGGERHGPSRPQTRPGVENRNHPNPPNTTPSPQPVGVLPSAM
ncbi:MAG: hypothetical protein ACKPGI_00495, partial [Verrucomicrobiota bacterium]